MNARQARRKLRAHHNAGLGGFAVGQRDHLQDRLVEVKNLLPGGAFLMRAPIRLTTSSARSVPLTMPASASLTSTRSGGVLSNHRSAALACVRAAAMGCFSS